MNITRRAALLGATASAVAVTTAAASGLHRAPTVSVDRDIAGLTGLPLAAVHIQRAVAAMGDFHFGKWEVTIRSGEPDQKWGFRRVDHPVTAVSSKLMALSRALQDALRAERNAYDASDNLEGVDASDICDKATVAVGDAIRAVLQVDPEAVPAGEREAYQAAMAACARWFIIAEGDYTNGSAECCAQVRLIDLALAGTAFDDDGLWLWHVKGKRVPARPAYQFPAP